MKILARVSRKVAIELGDEYGIRPFYSSALMRLDQRAAIELLVMVSRLYPADAEARGEYVRRYVARPR